MRGIRVGGGENKIEKRRRATIFMSFFIHQALTSVPLFPILPTLLSFLSAHEFALAGDHQMPQGAQTKKKGATYFGQCSDAAFFSCFVAKVAFLHVTWPSV